MGKLIILRGNSGCGKTTTAQRIRNKVGDKVALIEQDILRRRILGETGKGGDDNVELIEKTVMFALNKGYDVILEGILPKEYYGEMLERICLYAPKVYTFYFDVSIEETLRRHETKSNKQEFGEAEMRDWYREKDYLGLENEYTIPESYTEESVAEYVLSIIL